MINRIMDKIDKANTEVERHDVMLEALGDGFWAMPVPRKHFDLFDRVFSSRNISLNEAIDWCKMPETDFQAVLADNPEARAGLPALDVAIRREMNRATKCLIVIGRKLDRLFDRYFDDLSPLEDSWNDYFIAKSCADEIARAKNNVPDEEVLDLIKRALGEVEQEAKEGRDPHTMKEHNSMWDEARKEFDALVAAKNWFEGQTDCGRIALIMAVHLIHKSGLPMDFESAMKGITERKRKEGADKMASLLGGLIGGKENVPDALREAMGL